MTSVERIINLALLLGSTPQGVATSHIRCELYPANQSLDAFERMFSRDKETLRAAGIQIDAAPGGITKLSQNDSFCDTGNLSAAQRCTLALAGYAQLSEPLFPLPLALRLALTKLSGFFDVGSAPALKQLATGSALGRFDPESEQVSQSALLPELLRNAVIKREKVFIHYTNKHQVSKKRKLSPYGLFLLSGRWYVVGLDGATDSVRTFKLTRISRADLCDESFEIPGDFSLQDWVVLPFEIGTATPVRTMVIIPSALAAKAQSLTRGAGSIAPRSDGDLDWYISYRDYDAFITFVLENGLKFGNDAHRETARKALEAMVKAP